MSGLTTPSTGGGTRIQVNAATAGLLQLAGVTSPQRDVPSAEQQEDLIERRLYSEVPPAGDSEEEPSASEDDN